MSKAILKTRAEHAEKEAFHLSRALCDIIGGKVKWFRHGRYRAGLIRPLAADGGTIVLRFLCRGQSPTTSAHSLEEMYAAAVNLPPTNSDGEAWRQVIFQAMNHARIEQNKNNQPKAAA